jgi:transposase
MPKGKPGERKKRYTGEYKQKVLEHMRKNSLGYRETGRLFGINYSVIVKWERVYLTDGIEALHEERRGKANALTSTKIGKQPSKANSVEEDLIAENQRLKMEIEYLKKLNALVQEKQLQKKKHR